MAIAKSENVKITVHGKKKEEFDFRFDYGFMKKICHQRPNRSFFIFGKQFPLCARCSGMYFSFIIGVVLSIINFRLLLIIKFYHVFLFFIVLAIPILVDGFTQLFKLRKSNNILRLITGLIGGFGTGVLIVYLIGKLMLFTQNI